MKHIVETVIQWFRQNKRDLPWRQTTDPYKVWLSEIILQQTKMEQGLPYYEKLLATYPTVKHLAVAPRDELLKYWQGLGYYRRAENLLKTALIVTHEYKGKFPDDVATLKKLPGIGEYTAAAIASIAFGKAVAVVDGNVYRVLARLFGIKTPIGDAKAKKEFGKVMQQLMKGFDPREFNESIMEFGALQCIPVSPDCNNCPLQNRCYAYAYQEVKTLPVVKPKRKSNNRYIYYFVVKWQNHLLLRKREEADIWRNLYDFPSLEFNKKQDFEKVLEQIDHLPMRLHKEKAVVTLINKTYKHTLTHLNIFARFIMVDVEKKPERKEEKTLYLVHQTSLKNFPVSRLIERFLIDRGF